MLYMLLLKKKDDWWILPTSDWRQKAVGPILCGTCVRIHSAVYPMPIEPHLRQLSGKRSVEGIGHGGPTIMRNDLVALLKPFMPEFVWGRCFDKNGDLIKTHNACYTKSWIWIRGGTGSHSRGRCPECDRPRYTRKGDPYVLRRELNSKAHVYQDGINTVYVTEHIRDLIPWRQFSDIELFPIDVLDEPTDGLSCDPLEWPAAPRE